MRKQLVLLILCLFIIGCSTVSEVRLNNSLGIDVFRNMGFIKQHNVNLGICMDEKLRDLVLTKKLGEVSYQFNVGDVVTVKLIKALSYNFDGLEILDKKFFAENSDLNAILFIELQDVDMSNAFKSGWISVTATSEGRLALKGTIFDTDNKVVWVGTAKEEGKGTKASYGGMYGATGEEFAIGMDNAIELAVASLIRQMFLSDNLRKNIKLWEDANSGR